jgi:hypothetical protein
MGKWATYRKRSRPTATAPLGPPPAPLLTTQVNSLFQIAQGADDTGGAISLWYRELEIDEFQLIASAGWEPGMNWSNEVETLEGYYKATEAGNGTAYVGTSDFSNVLHYVPP